MDDRDLARRANLITILRDLAWSGVETLQGQAHLLGGPAKTIHAIVMGRAMPDAMARKIEWATHKPLLWMDEAQASHLDH
jgi:hypothetical protein